ncbi:unnamed protein product [Rotaria socialis]|uniref:Uncharacterized protein n=1 Tax=Rotaria socialis TaxID=392032 RepID=A0A817N1V0_9BILA|nr:unnamed protein product [Rotaria socialis]CAF3243050.1 unnamed protein product [Rotaria socialis]CAF3476947.1 unnamed protein product [Rotaria socialis]CAF3642956.1 unnamed protein product [Rotaria socialis]CAF4474207.1 unnamed protein product [Rotaria socialis]
MLNHQIAPSYGDAPWSSYYNDEYATTTPWYDLFWHRYGKITRRKFDSIQIGMTRQQVTDIIGGPGRVTSESQLLNIHVVRIIYQGRFWSPKSATLVFYNGLLRCKSRY